MQILKSPPQTPAEQHLVAIRVLYDYHQQGITDPGLLAALNEQVRVTGLATLPAETESERNPFQLSLGEQLERLRQVNEEEGWGIPWSTFLALVDTAPVWPLGRLTFRSLRIRFGEGEEGVALTFEAHIKRTEKVFEGHVWRWKHLRSGADHLRLLVGNDTHQPIVEWIVIDLDANRQRESITAVRGPLSLADELLAFVWLFPDYIRSINREESPAFVAGGYELNTATKNDDEPWMHVPSIGFYDHRCQVRLDARWYGDMDRGLAVPVLRE